MIQEDLSGKRMLLLAGTNLTIEAIELAQKMGVWVAVTDYNTETPAKKIANAAFNMSTTDLEGLEKLCKEQNIDGIFTNWIDSMLPWGARICEKMGYPYPFSEQQINEFTDKEKFKKLCIKYGVPVPKQYFLEEVESERVEVEFPVIVKPVDNSGSRGISVCNDFSDLKKALEKAKKYSRSGNILIEQYLDEDEITVNYVIENGNVMLTCIHDRYFNTEQKDVLKTPDIYIYPSKYTNYYKNNIDSLVKNMLIQCGLKNGSIFLQACVKNGKVYFYETGMRLNGCKIYHIVDAEYGYNALERLLCYSLTGSMGQPSAEKLINHEFQHWYSTLSLLARPGIIEKIEGIEDLKSNNSVVGINQWHYPGEEITPEMRGTLPQTIVRVTVKAKNKEELFSLIQYVYKTVRVFDSLGNEMLLTPHNIDDLRNQTKYELND